MFLQSYQFVCIEISLYRENNNDSFCEATVNTGRGISCRVVPEELHEVSS